MRYVTGHSIFSAIKRAALAVFVCFGMTPALAQNAFSPAAIVNDRVITEFEVAQRQRFLTMLNTPGASREAVIEALIDESLRNQELEFRGLELNEEQIEAGLQEFAGRVELEASEFIAILEENGVAEETLVAFVETGIAWREYIVARYGSRVEISEEQIDRAIGSGGAGTSVRLLLTEIVIPSEPQNRVQVEELAQQIAASESTEEFEAYAREFSAAPTRDNGGRLPWQALDDLPPALRPLLLALAPGEISEIIPLPDAVAIFQLRDIDEVGGAAPGYASIDYAAYYLAGGRSEETLAQAERLKTRIDSCNDLYGEALGKPPEVLDRENRAPSEIPQDIARELSRLDPGEVSTALTRSGGQTLVFLMLCGRTAAANQEVDREQAAIQLQQNQLNALAESLMAQLRADARIEIK